jgi:hypothetical protein
MMMMTPCNNDVDAYENDEIKLTKQQQNQGQRKQA